MGAEKIGRTGKGRWIWKKTMKKDERDTGNRKRWK